MTTLRILSDISDAAQWAITVAIVVFIVLYTWLAQWWKNPFGLSIVLLDVCLLGILIPSLLAMSDASIVLRTTAWYPWLEACVLVLTTGVTVSRVYVWYHLHRRLHYFRDNSEKNSSPDDDDNNHPDVSRCGQS